MRARGRTNLTLPAWFGMVLLFTIVIQSLDAQTASTGATPAVSNVASNLALPNFGQITALSVNPRLVELALKYIF